MTNLLFFKTALLALALTPAFGQNTWSVSLQSGPTQFYGDLRQYAFYPVGTTNHDSANERGAFFGGLTINKQLSHRFGLQLGGSYGKLRGMKRQPYNSYFRANYTTAELTGSVNLTDLLLSSSHTSPWKIDAYAGAGMMFFRSTAYELGTGRVQRFTKNNLGDGTVQPASFERNWTIPMGVTAQYELTPRFDVGLDLRFTYVNTEHLDATVGGVSTSAFDLTGNRGRFDGADANHRTSANDKFGYAAITLTYKLGARAIQTRKTNNQYGYDKQMGRHHLRWVNSGPAGKQPAQVSEPKPKPAPAIKTDSVAVAKSAKPKPKPTPPRKTDPRSTKDTDSDGVPDYLDKQPKTPAGSVVSGSGESIDFDKYVTAALPQMACAEIFANIQFDTDKAVVKPQYYETLKRVVALMNKTPCRLQLAGHADQRASEAYNLALSRRRVEAVRQYLIRAGLTDSKRILTDYFGALKPIDDNTQTGLSRNRRVELKLMP